MELKDEINKKKPHPLVVQGCERPWEVAIKPFEVAPHVYYVGNSWVGAYLIDTGEGLVLIDATMYHQVYLVFESIRELGFNPKDIKILLLSHAHYDHCGGVRPIVEYTCARLYMGKEDELLLKERQDLLYVDGYVFGNFQADEYYDDNKPIIHGDITIHTIHTPGHTPGTTSFFFDVKDGQDNICHCGMHGGMGLNTLDNKYFEETGMPVSLREDFLKGLFKLRDMKIDIVLSSHPNQTRMLEKVEQISDTFNPYIDHTAWKRLIDERIEMVKKLID